MGLGGLCTARYFMRQEQQRIDALLDRSRRRRKRKQQRITKDHRLDDAEDDLGQMLLLAMAVNRLLVRKQALQPAEIARVARELDLADGVEDGLVKRTSAANGANNELAE